MSMDIDHIGPASIDRSECMRLLGTTSVGRIGLTLRGLPWVVPVRFVFDGARILVDVGSDPTFIAAARNAVVAFEADDVDARSHERWSVMATGIARPLHWTWRGDGDRDHADDGSVLAIEPEIMAGWQPAVAP